MKRRKSLVGIIKYTELWQDVFLGFAMPSAGWIWPDVQTAGYANDNEEDQGVSIGNQNTMQL